MLNRILFATLIASPVIAAEPGPWATYRGNAQRTGNTDGKAGPEKPAVLWAVPSQDHFIASPVPVGENVYFAGFGAFNRPTISMLPMANGKKPLWQRSAPYLRLASVSSPAVSGNFLVFGDGLHQDSGGVLHCLTADTGRPVWQLTLPGDLIHLEGAPTIAEGKVFMGAGAAGVICVDLETATLEGKPVTAGEVAKLQEAKWRELQAKYEADKKKDPDFAVPPSEDQLLKPEPKRHWQVGEKAWHVDAPVNYADGKLFVCTSFLDKEKVGERAIVCLDAKTGKEIWRQKLTYNPWGGASISGDTVIVGGSSVGMYLNELRGAKGELAAFDLKTGNPKWRKDIPGGIVASVALAGDLTVCTATDGKVRAYTLNDGDRRWLFDAKGPLFAPPAVAKEVAYVCDLQGVIHAIVLADGVPKWKFDLGNEPSVKAPGMIYGGVSIQNGLLFAGTCNHEGPNARKPSTIVAVGTAK